MANSDVIELISFASLSESDVRLLREANCIEAKRPKTNYQTVYGIRIVHLPTLMAVLFFLVFQRTRDEN